MSEEPREPKIVSTPGIVGGRPRLLGTRITVQDILGALAAGDTIDELLEDFPYLEREDFAAVLRYAADHLDHKGVAAE
ncbi:MAG: DUF433 domain-containing protein [Devosia indica]|uniref:DUF433 domain-containing protein n=1 Tax=Devosia TaxID=46913 RepID=UPI000CE99778|nr:MULTISPECIES: DUF433 domain-containing protein [Devosia]AVF03528.1 hypothetical protein C4375_07175 [Devosia sp. I507]